MQMHKERYFYEEEVECFAKIKHRQVAEKNGGGVILDDCGIAEVLQK